MNPKLEVEVKGHDKVKVATNNGLVHEETIRDLKQDLLFDSLEKFHYLVEVKKSYPTNNETELQLDLDLILLSRSRYQELKEIEAKYLRLCN